MLDPHVKLNTFKRIGIPTLALDAAEDYIKEVYHRYKKELDEEGGPKRQQKVKKAKLKKSEKASFSFFYDASQLSNDDDHDHDGEGEGERERERERELRLYFSQGNTKVSERIEAYYTRNEALFPAIFQIAKNYLSMMAMSSPSESLLSRVKSIVTDKRNRLQPHTIRMLAVLKARGIIRDEASVYLDSARESDDVTYHPNVDHAKSLDTSLEKLLSGSGESHSANISCQLARRVCREGKKAF